MNEPYMRSYEIIHPGVRLRAAKTGQADEHENEEDGLEGAPSPRQRAEEHPEAGAEAHIGIFAGPATRVRTSGKPCTVRHTARRGDNDRRPTCQLVIANYQSGVQSPAESSAQRPPRAPFLCDGLGLFDLCRQHQTNHCSRMRRCGRM